MTDEDFIRKMNEGMQVKRTTLRSQWYGHTFDTRYNLDGKQIYKLLTEGKLAYLTDKKLTAVLPKQLVG